ncbi:MAG: hypothetical protein WBN83_07520 [Desulfoprunum sp.]|uniref:hypothetical protein n=1 Tax=Desulfoprunum sp. TaxID=2020866 RepID=UPI003C733EF9
MNASKNNESSVMSRRFDLAGFDCLRVTRLLMLNRIIPIGNFGGGGGVRCLVVLAVLHLLGRPLFTILIRYEQRLHSLYMFLKNQKNRR